MVLFVASYSWVAYWVRVRISVISFVMSLSNCDIASSSDDAEGVGGEHVC